MKISPLIHRRLEESWGPITGVRSVGGGCVTPALRIDFADNSVFLKHSSDAPAGLFAVEAAGLEALRQADSGLRVPAVLEVRDVAAGAGPDEPGWILMEWLEPGSASPQSAEQLGRGLAALHAPVAGGWGWERDGFIGTLPQPNLIEDGTNPEGTPSNAATWAEFWRGLRLEPQLRLARDAGRRLSPSSEWDALFARLPEQLAPAETDGPSLLHGDLWSGNVLSLGGAGVALVDPAAYRGHREVDLAMMELFGGFDPAVFAVYEETRPLWPGFRAERRPVYQLYYLLVHLNLFGNAYAERAGRALRAALAA